MLNKFRHSVKELDLSFNLLTDVDFLSGFYNLHTLILDNNQIISVSQLPYLPKLTTLSVNSNLIMERDFEMFVDKLKNSFPSLQVHFLSYIYFIFY